MPKTSINYLYFGAIFILLGIIAAGSIFTKENLGGSQPFFFLYALGQVILETTLFIFLAHLIQRSLGRLCLKIFIGITFFLLVLHTLDFLMDRILDLTVWEALHVFVLEENWQNFLLLLEASGIPLLGWVTIFATIALIPFVGIVLYQISEKMTQKKPLYIRQSYLLQALLCLPCGLLFWDFSASKAIHPDAYTAFINSLPWKFTFLHPETVMLSTSGPLHQPWSEQEVAQAIANDKTVLKKRPNVYLFIIESLRADSIQADIAPHLFAFKNRYAQFDLTASNGNGTHLSWFSLFHSQFPYFWQAAKQNWKSGSPALRLLKKWGYQIHLYTSAQLSYYGMDKLLFGETEELLDSRQDFHQPPPLLAADSDTAALLKLQKDMAENPHLQEGQVFLIFWDGTHFDYSWPKNWAPKFVPFAQEMAYFKAFQSTKTIEQIKNRYHNAVNYMDALFGHFFNGLPNREEAVVIVIGDHGEEFFDHGHLFHNSHLTREQTHVPLYFKWGNGLRPVVSRPIVSQMDIFPSLLDYLGGNAPSFLEGNSLFHSPKWPFAVTARFNAGLTPYEFCLQNGQNKVIAQFANRHNIFQSDRLRLVSLRTSRDEIIHHFPQGAENWVKEEFGAALDRLFDSSD